MIFAYLDALTGDLIGTPVKLDVDGGKTDHGGIAINQTGSKVYFLMNNQTNEANILTAL